MTAVAVPELTAGIDVAKDKLDVFIPDPAGQGQSFSVDNRTVGWKRLARACADAGVRRVGLEATGGYERGVVRHLQAAGLTVLVMQPLQVKAFARLHLRRAKNDRMDAALIGASASALDPHGLAPDPRLRALADQLTYVEQIEDDIRCGKTRLEHLYDPRLRRTVTADIARLEKRRGQELRRIEAALRTHADLARRFDLVLSIRGIGQRTAVALTVRLPELGRITREQAAALAGLAPFDCDSGRHKGQRRIAGGRGPLRHALYAAALPAALQWNPALQALYARLRARQDPQGCLGRLRPQVADVRQRRGGARHSREARQLTAA
jgi:transposase